MTSDNEAGHNTSSRWHKKRLRTSKQKTTSEEVAVQITSNRLGTDKQTYKQTNKQTNKHTYKQTRNKQTKNKQTKQQTNIQTNNDTHMTKLANTHLKVTI